MQVLTGVKREHGTRLARLGRYASWVLLALSWLLALGLAALGTANLRSVQAVAGEALEGRALDVALARRWTLLALRPRTLPALQEAIESLPGDGVESAALVTARGRVVAASDAGQVGRSWLGRIPRIGRSGHYLRRIGFGVYEVWLRVPRPGAAWRRWRRFWRRMREMRRRCLEDGRCGPGWPGPGGAHRGPHGGMRGPPAGGLGWPPPARPLGPVPPPAPQGTAPDQALPGPYGPGPFLHLRIRLEAPGVRAALRRARSIRALSVGVALSLLLISTMVFLAQRRARRLERDMAEQERFVEVGRLAAVLAHEIRNPLGVMKGRVQMAIEKLEHGDLGLGVVVEQAARLERLVNALLDYSRPTEPRRRMVDLKEQILAVLELVAPQAEAQGLLLVTDLEKTSACVDPDQFQQLLLNLLWNALDVSRQTVTVALKHRGDTAILQVTDTGPGIPEEMVERIFSPFFSTKTRGTGLGLAVARRIAEAHGGSIRVENVPDRGARFEVRLPRKC